jgi:hypothetical protein
MTNPKDHDEIAQKLKDTAGVQAALKQAAHDAVQEHARAGQKIVVWRDNQVVWEDPNGEEPTCESTTDK